MTVRTIYKAACILLLPTSQPKSPYVTPAPCQMTSSSIAEPRIILVSIRLTSSLVHSLADTRNPPWYITGIPLWEFTCIRSTVYSYFPLAIYVHLHGHLLIVFSLGNLHAFAHPFTRILSWHSACKYATVYSYSPLGNYSHSPQGDYSCWLLRRQRAMLVELTSLMAYRHSRALPERLYIGTFPSVVKTFMLYDSPFDLP
jgi:hypothetical protein